MRRFLALAAILAVTAAPAPSSAEDVVVFAAASLSDAIGEIARGFEARTGHAVVASYAGSNELARQIQAGAPAGVFVSAHPGRVDELEQAGLVARENRVDLLGNRLVVVVPGGVAPGDHPARAPRRRAAHRPRRPAVGAGRDLRPRVALHPRDVGPA